MWMFQNSILAMSKFLSLGSQVFTLLIEKSVTSRSILHDDNWLRLEEMTKAGKGH